MGDSKPIQKTKNNVGWRKIMLDNSLFQNELSSNIFYLIHIFY